jgi:hypothetical protein
MGKKLNLVVRFWIFLDDSHTAKLPPPRRRYSCLDAGFLCSPRFVFLVRLLPVAALCTFQGLGLQVFQLSTFLWTTVMSFNLYMVVVRLVKVCNFLPSGYLAERSKFTQDFK